MKEELPILFRDEHLVAVHKPSGLLVHRTVLDRHETRFAVQIVLSNNKASISLVQRHLSIGYNKAANLLEAMEKAGLVSAMNGRGQREILAPSRAE